MAHVFRQGREKRLDKGEVQVHGAALGGKDCVGGEGRESVEEIGIITARGVGEEEELVRVRTSLIAWLLCSPVFFFPGCAVRSLELRKKRAAPAPSSESERENALDLAPLISPQPYPDPLSRRLT